MSDELKKLTDWSKLEKLLEDQQSLSVKDINLEKFVVHCKGRVRGQDKIVEDVCRLLTLEWSRETRRKPVASLLFLGPTGTGKTELAKAIAEYLYKDEKNMLRFDCSEFSGPQSKDRLIGSPPGYVGSQDGGQLTRPMLSQNERVILFDEIEKSHPAVFDLFLQMMGEGRLTDQGNGMTADFTKSIVILTSNALADKISPLRKQFIDDYEYLNAVKSTLANDNVFRPEILGRLDRICVFGALEGKVMAEIALLKILKLGADYGLQVEFVAPEALKDILLKNQKVSRFGVRELERIIFDLFAQNFTDAKKQKKQHVKIGIDQNQQFVIL
jgi:ATP-dependent Clp protease ATP-binding subunit ClpA